MDVQGTFAIYEKRGATNVLINYYTVPHDPWKKVRNKVEFRQIDADTYKLFVHAQRWNRTQSAQFTL